MGILGGGNVGLWVKTFHAGHEPGEGDDEEEGGEGASLSDALLLGK